MVHFNWGSGFGVPPFSVLGSISFLKHWVLSIFHGFKADNFTGLVGSKFEIEEWEVILQFTKVGEREVGT